MTKDKVNSKYLTITKKVNISEVNYIISISTLKHRIASDFEGLFMKYGMISLSKIRFHLGKG